MSADDVISWKHADILIRVGWWYVAYNKKLCGPYTTEHKANVSFEVLMNRLASCAGGSCE